MITKDDDKGGDKKLKDQSKNNSSESGTIQEFKIRIKKNLRLKKKVRSQESRFKVQDLKNQDQESREGLIKICIKKISQKLSST